MQHRDVLEDLGYLYMICLAGEGLVGELRVHVCMIRRALNAASSPYQVSASVCLCTVQLREVLYVLRICDLANLAVPNL